MRHVWSQGLGNTSVVCLGWCMMTCTGWLFLSECSTSLLWQPIVIFATELHGTSPTTVCQSPKFLVASICDLPYVINCQLCEFAAALLGPVHFLSLDQQSGIHCLIICTIQLLTPNNLGGTWRRICSPDIWNVSALEVLRNHALQIDIYLLTYYCHVSQSETVMSSAECKWRKLLLANLKNGHNSTVWFILCGWPHGTFLWLCDRQSVQAS